LIVISAPIFEGVGVATGVPVGLGFGVGVGAVVGVEGAAWAMESGCG
jgi:hypothetical protein